MRGLVLPGLLLLWGATCIAQPLDRAGFSSAGDRSVSIEAGHLAAAFTMARGMRVNVFDDSSSGHVARRSLPRPPAGPRCYACVPS